MIFWLKNNIQGILICLLCLLLVVFVVVVFSVVAEGWMSQHLGLSGKNETLTFLGLSMGGVLLALQAVIANIRAKAMEDAAKEQAKANKYTERGQRQERLKNAIEHLGHDSVSIRLGGAYELFHLAQDTKELRQTVLDILCSHIRGVTAKGEYRKKYKSEPSEEIQSLLNLMFVQEHKVFKSLDINLRGSWLNGAYLNEARLENADLVRINLQGAQLFWAKLQGANLLSAQLVNTKLPNANLQGAVLMNAMLQGVVLNYAQLQGAELSMAQLQGASLTGTKFQGITSKVDLFPSFEECLRNKVNRVSDLSSIIFSGGLLLEDLEVFINGLSEDAANDLRSKLTQHIDMPAGNELPVYAGAITGSYTEEEAEQWIAEYREAISEDSENKDR